MGFFDTLRRSLSHEPDPDEGRKLRQLQATWGLDAAPPAWDSPDAADSARYDRAQWHKKLKRILDELPGSRPEWDGLMTESRALGFDPDWVAACQRDEFRMLIRRAVADRHFTEPEHRKLDLARDLIGIPEAEAIAEFNAVVAEAESFFGAPVEEG